MPDTSDTDTISSCDYLYEKLLSRLVICYALKRILKCDFITDPYLSTISTHGPLRNYAEDENTNWHLSGSRGAPRELPEHAVTQG